MRAPESRHVVHGGHVRPSLSPAHAGHRGEMPGHLMRPRRSARASSPGPRSVIDGTEEFERIVAADEVARHLTTVPGVGPVTATAYVATVDDVTRFRGAHQVKPISGWFPANGARARSSAEATSPRRGTAACAGSWSRPRGGILRRRKRPQTAALRDWAERIAGRRGRSIAVVALARTSGGISFAIWRDGTVYDATKVRGPLPARRAA